MLQNDGEDLLGREVRLGATVLDLDAEIVVIGTVHFQWKSLDLFADDLVVVLVAKELLEVLDGVVNVRLDLVGEIATNRQNAYIRFSMLTNKSSRALEGDYRTGKKCRIRLNSDIRGTTVGGIVEDDIDAKMLVLSVESCNMANDAGVTAEIDSDV